MAFFLGNKQTSTQNQTANIFMFELSPKNILITGSNGQLGKELQALSKNHEANFNFIYTGSKDLDITNLEVVNSFVRENQIHYIINCAAYTAVDRAEDEVEKCFQINRDGVFNLGIAAVNNNAKVIHVSTDYVFDGEASKPYKEDDQVNPQSVYGKSKLEGEQQLMHVCPESIIIRTSWLYSTHGNNFVKTMIRLGKERECLSVVSDQVGSPTNARDLAYAIIRILDWVEAHTFNAGIYHFANKGQTSWFDFTLAIHRIANITNCKVTPIATEEYPTKATRPKYSVLDISKITKTFELDIPQWEDSLGKCIKAMMLE